MNSLMNIVTMILFIFLLKTIITLYDRCVKFKDKKFKFTIDVKRDSINKMSELEFEGFCKWLFEGTGEYSNVELISDSNDNGVNIILTDLSNKKIFVECKRYNTITDDSINNEDCVISGITCQKLTGAMVANNIKYGIIITTGNINPNSIEYVNKLKNGTDIDIKILTMADIIKMLENRIDKIDYPINVII